VNRRQFVFASASSALLTGKTFANDSVAIDPAFENPSARQELANDPLRPQYHLLPQAGFVGDPCAPRFFGDKFQRFARKLNSQYAFPNKHSTTLRRNGRECDQIPD